MYDAIVVGTRVAGAPTAMLLARRGLKCSRSTARAFPSDTLSTHQVQVPGVARLARWGLLERLGGTPATRRVRFDPGPVVLEGRMAGGRRRRRADEPAPDAARRVLVDAARDAGAEVREGFAVDELCSRTAG
jgi:glycine/D-amino acid oxidase-like deaminating enzyme